MYVYVYIYRERERKISYSYICLHHLAEGSEPEEGQELHQLLLVEGAYYIILDYSIL